MRRFRTDERGAVAVIVAASSAMILGLAALAVDLGSVFLQTRKLQGMADLAALSAARDLAHAQSAAEATAAANGWSKPLVAEVTLGTYAADPAVPRSERFAVGGAPATAVRVTLRSQADLFFGAAILGRATTPIQRSATAANADLAAFSIGSRLAALDGGVANALLSGLTGSKISLSLMDYQALATADVDLLRYVSALRTEANLGAASFDDVLSSQVTTGKALDVLGKVLSDGGQDRAAAAVNAIARAADRASPAALDRLVDLGPIGQQDRAASGAGLKANALDLTDAALLLSKQGRQVKLDLGAGVPGLADLDIWLAVGERPNNSPWLAVGRAGEVTLRTEQMRLYVEAKVLPTGLVKSGGASLVSVPILLEAAPAEAKLASVDCAGGGAAINARTGVARARLAQVDVARLNDFKSALAAPPAKLVDASGLLTITGVADVTAGGGDAWRKVAFSKAEIAARATKTVATNDLAAAVASSLISRASLDISVLGLNLGLSKTGLLSSIQSILDAAAPPIDRVVNSLTAQLGLRLGEADVRVEGLACGGSALVG